jgi:peptidoglycan pentaglycine glycine transferase (the second and third glycine)
MLEELTKEEFNEYASKHPLNMFFQSSYWGELKSITGWKHFMVGIKNDGKIEAATLILGKKIPIFNRYIYYAPRGFLIDYNNTELLKKFTLEVKKYLKKKKGIFIKINPYLIYQERDINGDIVENGIDNKNVVEELKKLGFIHTGFTINYGKDLEPRWISVLDLEGKTEEGLLKDMRSTTRWGINNSYKHGLKLVEIDKSRINEFKKLMEHTGERRGFIDRSEAYYEKMYDAFSKDDKIKIMLVELDIDEYLYNLNNQKQQNLLKQVEAKNKPDSAKAKRVLKELQSQFESLEKRISNLEKLQKEKGNKIVVAGGLFMTFGTQVVSLFGASYREYMKFNGQFFLNFKMIKYALNNGYKKYNFYGITGEFNEDSEMFGLFDFKRGFNAHVEELIGEFTLITNKFFYKVYNLMFEVYKKTKKMKGHNK